MKSQLVMSKFDQSVVALVPKRVGHPARMPATLERGRFPVMAAAVPETTATLLRLVRAGDADAKGRIVARYLPVLRRWAHGRLPQRRRDISDTDDLVQIALMRVLNHLHTFESKDAGSLLAYLRQSLLNEMRTEMRKHAVRGEQSELDDHVWRDEQDSVVGHVLGLDRLRAYESALATLTREQQSVVLMRIEFGMDYQDIADELGLSKAAVRMRIARALESMSAHIAEHWEDAR
jgi:RNA polymerase sigma-70 factor (ECF subfamily)